MSRCKNHTGNRISLFHELCPIFAVFAGVLFNAPARADDREQREYVIYVNGKESGQSTMTILKQDDGLTYMTGKVKVDVQQALFKYSLVVDASEWWRDHKLIGVKCQTIENGKKMDVVVTAAAAEQKMQLRVNGKERGLKPDIWTTSYWKLPDPRFHNKPVALLGIDDGKEYNGNLQFVATEQLNVQGKPETCYRFKVTGGPSPTIDLWFDRYHRLVRQEFVDLGHKTIVHLVSIRR